jgi:hypothetical protein
MKEDFKIEFLIIGAQKCATTWLYECIKEHPEICLPKHKREHEYIGGKIYKERGLEWYYSLFNCSETQKVAGAVSVEYIVNPDSPNLVHQLNHDMKFVLNVRNPVDRAISAIKWYIRKKEIPDNHYAIYCELKKAVENFKFSEVNPDDKFEDILYRGLYAKLLERYYELFPPDSFLILHYNDIKQNSKAVLKNLFTFLNVNNEFTPSNFQNQPKKNSNNPLLIKIERAFPKNKAVSFLLNKIHQKIPSSKGFLKYENEISQLLNHFYTTNKNLVGLNVI